MTDQRDRARRATLTARASGALWWPAERLLCVADLHLCRSERLARRGGTLLPPYETAETLDRLAAEIAALAPARVVCLGDSFDDCAAGAALAPADAARLTALMAGRDWVWIAGNHDPGAAGARRAPPAPSSRSARSPSATRPRREPRPARSPATATPSCGCRCAAAASPAPAFSPTRARLILPAFGAYTGGLHADHPALAALFGPGARAILTGEPCLAVPLPARGHAGRGMIFNGQLARAADLRLRQAVDPAAGGQRVGEQAGDRHRPDPARHRGDRAGDRGDAGEIDVADQLRRCRPAPATRLIPTSITVAPGLTQVAP